MVTNKIYNTVEEISIRIMILISIDSKKLFSLEQLVILDYLNLYVIKVNSKTLHPEYLFKDLELYNHRPQIKASLLYLISKDLIDLTVDENGIRYGNNINTNWCVNKLEGSYVSNLKVYSKKCLNKYGDLSTKQLNKLFLIREENSIWKSSL